MRDSHGLYILKATHIKQSLKNATLTVGKMESTIFTVRLKCLIVERYDIVFAGRSMPFLVFFDV